MTVVDAPRAVRLRDERIEPEQQAHREHGDREEQHAREANRADRGGAEGTDHQRVHDPHRHPADLGDHDRGGERQHRAEFVTQATRHGWAILSW